MKKIIYTTLALTTMALSSCLFINSTVSTNVSAEGNSATHTVPSDAETLNVTKDFQK